MAGTSVEPIKANHGEIALRLSAAAGPAAEERQGGDQEDRRTGKTDGEGKGWGCFLFLLFWGTPNRWAYAMLMYRPHFTV